MEICDGFKSSYAFRILDELPQAGRRFYYPGAAMDHGKDGPIVQVSVRGCENWIGIFAFGHGDPLGMSGFYTLPDPDKLCVVARGDGYIVSSSKPTQWQAVPLYPVRRVIPLPGRNQICFVGLTKIVAFGPNGLMWTSKRLSWDSLSVTSVGKDEIEGTAWDIRSETTVGFIVNLDTGEHTGGISEY